MLPSSSSSLLAILLLGSQLLSCHGVIHAEKNHTRNPTTDLYGYLFNTSDPTRGAFPGSSFSSYPWPPVTKLPTTTTTYGYCERWQQVCETTAADTTLKFVRMGLKRIGDAFVESEKAGKLYLDENDISEISSNAFTSLIGLRLVSLCKNRIPTEKLLWFSYHPSLQTLIVDDNKPSNASKLDKILDRLPKLEQLSLKRNGISHFGVDLSNFAPTLAHLDLSGNNLDELNFLDNLPTQLTHLHLDDNQIGQLKSNGLKSVQVLSISGNRIKQLCYNDCIKSSLSLEGMERLTTLNLSRNNINEVTEDAFQFTKRLIDLDLSHNRIKSLPGDIPRLLTTLETLRLNHNQLATVPNICSLSRLNHLDLSYNNIADVTAANLCTSPYGLHVKTLLMAGNRITEADNAFEHLWNLEKLDLSENLITNLPIELITRARSLKVLSLRNNSINDIDRLFTARTNNLEELHLQENPFYTIRHSNQSRLVIRLKDEPQDESYLEELDENNEKDNTIDDKDSYDEY